MCCRLYFQDWTTGAGTHRLHFMTFLSYSFHWVGWSISTCSTHCSYAWKHTTWTLALLTEPSTESRSRYQKKKTKRGTISENSNSRPWFFTEEVAMVLLLHYSVWLTTHTDTFSLETLLSVDILGYQSSLLKSSRSLYHLTKMTNLVTLVLKIRAVCVLDLICTRQWGFSFLRT